MASLCLLFFSFTAEFWANSKPHFMSYNGRLYAPLFVDYHPTEFGRDDIYVMDRGEIQHSGPATDLDLPEVRRHLMV